jgi:hypothetical protein
MRANVPSSTAATQLLRTRISKICVAIIGTTAAEMIEKATAVVRETPFLEFRLDYLEKPANALPKLKQFLGDNTAANLPALLRPKWKFYPRLPQRVFNWSIWNWNPPRP